MADLDYDSVLGEDVPPGADAVGSTAGAAAPQPAEGRDTGGESPGPTRLLRFADERGAIVVSASYTEPDRVHLSVDLAPADPAAVRVVARSDRGPVEATVDREGHVELDVHAGLVSLVVRSAAEDEGLVQTAWVRL